MKIAISSKGIDLNAQVDPRFGRCQQFIIIDPDTMQFEVIDNSAAASTAGAGIAAAQSVAGKSPEAVLTGYCGPNAFKVLESAGIKVISEVSGTINEVIENYKQGKYKEISKANTSAHTGMGQS